MRVGIARAEKRGGTAKAASIMKVGSRRPDQAAGECDQSAVIRRISGDELGGETCPLRKACDHDLVLRNSLARDVANNILQLVER